MHTSGIIYSFPNINYFVPKNNHEAHDIALAF